MFALFFILPILIFLAFDAFDIKKYGFKNRIKKLGFWLPLAGCAVFSQLMLVFLFMSFTAFLSAKLPYSFNA